MRSGGINWLAVLVSAVAVYAVGFIIYGLLFPEAATAGMTEAEISVGMSRMIYSPLMPILTAVFLAVLFKWGQVSSVATGASWAAVVALASAIPTLLYGWVYAGGSTESFILDGAHLLIGHVAAGAIIGGWK